MISDLDQLALDLINMELMQDAWVAQGIDYIEEYIEDVEGDWLEQWGRDNLGTYYDPEDDLPY